MNHRDATGAPPRRHRGEQRDRAEEPALQLAQTLIALHRAERAPRAMVQQVELQLGGRQEARRCARWTRRWEFFSMQVGGWPVAGMAALALSLLVTWQHQRRETARREAAEAARQEDQASTERESSPVMASGVAVPGSLQWRLYGDEIGMGHCEGSFLLASASGAAAAPVRVRWTRCDLPDALSAELRLRFSPARGAPPLAVSVRGQWTGSGEFEAVGVRLEP